MYEEFDVPSFPKSSPIPANKTGLEMYIADLDPSGNPKMVIDDRRNRAIATMQAAHGDEHASLVEDIGSGDK